MFGTIVNTISIIVGSTIGGIINKRLQEKYKKILFDTIGLCVFALGINMFCSHISNSKYPVLFIFIMVIGTLIGSYIDIDGKFNKLIEKFSKESLAKGLSTAILLFCIGTLSIIGPVQSALYGNNSLLFINSTLDFITSIILSSAYGFGIMWAGLILFLWQGLIYTLSLFLGQCVSDTFFCELSIIGGLLILSSGLSMMKIKELKTINMLPSLFIIPILWLVFYLIKIL